MTIESDPERSAGSRTIKSKLAELHDRLLGVEITADSTETADVYKLFVNVWQWGRNSGNANFHSAQCDWPEYHHYFDGITDDLWHEELDENDNLLGWDWDLAVSLSLV